MAASKKTIAERQLQVLVSKIRNIHERAENATVDSALETCWTYGDLIAELRLSGQVGYHNSVLKDLSRETGIVLRILQHSVAFSGRVAQPLSTRLPVYGFRIAGPPWG